MGNMGGKTRFCKSVIKMAASKQVVKLRENVSRVEMRTPGVTDVQLPDLFGSGAGETPALTLT